MADLSTVPSPGKRAFNLSLNEGLVTQAKNFTGNLSATVETLLDGFVAEQRQLQATRQQAADACVADWNLVHSKVGSFADEHSPL